jgi:hypothetical protein
VRSSHGRRWVRHLRNKYRAIISSMNRHALPANRGEPGTSRLWHPKLESTVRYLGIEVDDALEIAEQTEV